MSHWTAEEIAILKAGFKDQAADGVAALLPNKSRTAIVRKANRLRLKSFNNKEWAADEDDILIRHYPRNGGKYVSELTGRSIGGVLQRAQHLKDRLMLTPHGIPAGGWQSNCRK
jgi:hypothetical protein